MRQAYIVTYDIRHRKRLRQVYKIMRGYGRHVQLSVFQCELDPRERIELRAKLGQEIQHDEDQVLFIDIGPADGRGRTSIDSVGRAYVPNVRTAVIA